MDKGEYCYMAMAGQLGYGCKEEDFNLAMQYHPRFIGIDSGSTDSGPYNLGSGEHFASLESVRNELRFALKAALDAGIPFLVGSCGGGGGDLNLEAIVECAREVAHKHDLHFKLGVVHCELSKKYLKEKLREGKIISMGYLPELDEETIDRSLHTVGMMGAEVFTAALDMGADVVFAGRTSDTSIFAALPIRAGYSEDLIWPAAKLMECGAIGPSAKSAVAEPALCYIGEDYFVVRDVVKGSTITPLSTAATTMFENASPFHLYESSGMMDFTDAHYEQVVVPEENEPKAVKVTGTRFIPADQLTIKLESVEQAGYRSISVVTVREKALIDRLNGMIDECEKRMRAASAEMFAGSIGPEDLHFNVRVYGKDCILGTAEPKPYMPNEATLFIDVVAPKQAQARELCRIALANLQAMCRGLGGRARSSLVPEVCDKGVVYRFNMEHLLLVDDPLEPVRIEILEL